MADRLTGQRIHFLSLQTSIFCVECEVISENNTPYCYACGSQAVLSLSRVLGGSLRGQQTAHVINDVELDRLVRELISTVPALSPSYGERVPASFSAHAPSRSHARIMSHPGPSGVSKNTVLEQEIHTGELDLEPAISVIAERAQALTGATGAAIALRHGDEIVCRARTGRTAPDLGVRLQTDSGISADCVRTGEVVLCNDAERNPHVDLASCRRLGARSILVAPLRHFRRTLGVFEVLSGAPHAFDHRDVATMQLMSSMMVAAISRLWSMQPASRQQSA
ncbi:MAG TPA: GAF domain-containing protein [Terriglobales bacterium]|nr:GAF domain-containing protein [Terriglobales bacterium]